MSSPSRQGRVRIGFLVVLLLAFTCRLAFGLASAFWTEDERQVYLIGLQAFARHAWPYYGADIVWTGSRLPGALQGLLIAFPLAIAGGPESPFVLLNILSFGALAGFSSYLTRRLPQLPRWLIWGWLLTAPWTMHFSTHIINTSYILPGAIAFFLGFFEAVPMLSAGLLGPFAAWALMGFGLLWLVQIHLSWVLLPAYVVVAGVATLADARRRRSFGRCVAGLATGALPPLLLLLPTLVRGGLAATGGMERNVNPHWPGAWTLVTIAAQFLSFASPETSRFLALDSAHRLALLDEHRALVPLVVTLVVLAIVIPVATLLTGFSARVEARRWTAVRALAALTVLWIYTSYAFSIRGTQAHAFYVTFPVATLFAMSAWTRFATHRHFRRAAAAVLLMNAAFLAALAAIAYPMRSLYLNRSLVSEAIVTRDPRLLGERRVADRLPAALEMARLPAPAGFDRLSPSSDLVVVTSRWTPVAWGRVSAFDLTLRNDSPIAAYIDVRYRATYYDAAHHPIATSDGVIKEILQPGAVRRWPRLVDTRVGSAAAAAEFEITGAEPVVPAR